MNNGSGSISAQHQMLAIEESALKGTLKFAAILQLYLAMCVNKYSNKIYHRASQNLPLGYFTTVWEGGQLSFRSFEHRTPLPAE